MQSYQRETRMPHGRRFRDAWFAAALATLGALPLAAQVVDEGTFNVRIDGQLVGTEEFSIRQSGTGANQETIATGRVQLRLPSGTLEISPRLRASGPGADLVAYQVDVGGDSPRKIIGTLGSGRFSARISSPSGEQLREYVASSGAVVLDDGVAHHYSLLAQRSRGGQVPVLIPRENRQVVATVTSRGEQNVDIAGSTLRATQLIVQVAGGGERRLWVDGRNRVLRVEIPERSYVAVRSAAPR
jgi:hypothetical protein